MARSTSPEITCIQPDHFYPSGGTAPRPKEPDTLYDPEQDPLATRGIPVFRPSIEEFQDFEGYMEKVEVWGRKSGIVKIIPPQEWTKALPSTVPQLPHVRLRNPIEQRMDGGSGLFRQQNIEKRKMFSVMDWAQMCARDSLKAPNPNKTARGDRNPLPKLHESADSEPSNRLENKTKPETMPEIHGLSSEEQTFYSTFDPQSSWLPPNTRPSDYTPEACRKLERTFWRTCGIATPAWYGADMRGSLFTDATTTFNVANLPSLLSRLARNKSLPGVNTPYLYFGMWRATFAWHVEDMDLYSINYIHWGAPKFWYAIPNERSKAFEAVMRGFFPSDTSACPEFLRHKSYLASPNVLAESSCRPNVLVQHQGEFVITYPRGYHAGFNLGLNCAESINFALENWIDIGRKAKICQCVPDSVRIDVDGLLAEANRTPSPSNSTGSSKRKAIAPQNVPAKRKRVEAQPTYPHPGITIKIMRRDESPLRCCLCASGSEVRSGTLLKCHSGPPSYTGMHPVVLDRGDAGRQNSRNTDWYAHEVCAMVIPETWVDLVNGERMVFGIDCIVKDRWNLKCASCTKPAHKKHGAKIQCTRGKCSKAFHVSCAIDQEDVAYKVLDEVDVEVVLSGETQPDRSEATVTVPPAANLVTTFGSSPQQSSSSRGIKLVRKVNVSVLCSQHNPVIQEQKRIQKLEKMRRDLLALPELSRIRVRVSSGVFEVTLLSVNEPSTSVEVLWGDGEKRELKWGSIVWNSATSSMDGAGALTKVSQNDITHEPSNKASERLASSTSSSVRNIYPNFPPPVVYSPYPIYSPQRNGSSRNTRTGSGGIWPNWSTWVPDRVVDTPASNKTPLYSVVPKSHGSDPPYGPTPLALMRSLPPNVQHQLPNQSHETTKKSEDDHARIQAYLHSNPRVQDALAAIIPLPVSSDPEL